jgi:hypothetical protein
VCVCLLQLERKEHAIPVIQYKHNNSAYKREGDKADEEYSVGIRSGCSASVIELLERPHFQIFSQQASILFSKRPLNPNLSLF